MTIDQTVLGRAAETRLALEAARARCRTWLVEGGGDPATAEQALREVLRLLEDAPSPVSARDRTGTTA